jgi:hypothetical protein
MVAAIEMMLSTTAKSLVILIHRWKGLKGILHIEVILFIVFNHLIPFH